MRGLTVRQPWVAAIAAGEKDVDNRARSLGPYRGPVAIHAGNAWSCSGAVDPRVRELYGWYPERDPLQFPTGAVVAVGQLVDSHHPDDCATADGMCSRWADRTLGDTPVRAHLVFADVRRLDDPIPWPGALGLWTVPDHLERVLNLHPTGPGRT